MLTTITVRRYTSGCKRLLTGIAIAAAGCSDPSTSHLEPGAKVTLVDPSAKYIILGDSDRRSDPFPTIPQGSDAVVVSDDESEYDSRDVRIAIKGGEKDGISGTVARKILRPR